jgi:ubiquinone/menaquinone biosynthesis C-methylase UbiE
LSEQYHLGELKIAQDPSHPAHILPPSVPAGSRVLDVGCGAGQTLIAVYPHQLTFGIDIDLSALRLGRTLTNHVYFACSRAEVLPFRPGEFDLVTARVSLAYTDIRKSLREIRRVLKPGGLLWMTLHPFAIPWAQAKTSNWKGKLFFAYILLNSALFHLTQWQFPFLGKYESFQTEGGIRRALQRCGFSDVAIKQDRHFLVTARAVYRNAAA